jgi:hypothetical protein
VVDAAIAIQAFTMNAFGCIDNIAWIWVHEKDIKNGNGTELQRKHVGLRKPKVHDKLTKEFQAYLATRQDWFDSLVDFRDSLAHRIPLYIPPYVVPKARPTALPWRPPSSRSTRAPRRENASSTGSAHLRSSRRTCAGSAYCSPLTSSLSTSVCGQWSRSSGRTPHWSRPC